MILVRQEIGDVLRDFRLQKGRTLRQVASKASVALGYLSEEAWEQLNTIGVLRALQPARWGGGQVCAAEFLATITEIGRHSPAAGWVASVIGVHPWQLALFEERTQLELWGTDPAVANNSCAARALPPPSSICALAECARAKPGSASMARSKASVAPGYIVSSRSQP